MISCVCLFYKCIEDKGKIKTYKLPGQAFLSLFYVLTVCKEKEKEVSSLPFLPTVIPFHRGNKINIYKAITKYYEKKINTVLKCPRHLMSWDLEMTWWLTDGCDLGGPGQVLPELEPTWSLVEK